MVRIPQKKYSERSRRASQYGVLPTHCGKTGFLRLIQLLNPVKDADFQVRQSKRVVLLKERGVEQSHGKPSIVISMIGGLYSKAQRDESCTYRFAAHVSGFASFDWAIYPLTHSLI
jgi:hypothetical protein